jgi:NADH:ubiquinone oxidoreductase subunit K
MSFTLLHDYGPALVLIILFGIGAGAALGARHLFKRLTGLLIAQSAAILLSAALAFAWSTRDPLAGQIVMVGVMVMAGFALIGLALLVRLRETYGLLDLESIASEDDFEDVQERDE